MARKKAGGIAETVRTIVYAALIALLVRTFLFEPFNIPSGSMLPTLLIGGDRDPAFNGFGRIPDPGALMRTHVSDLRGVHVLPGVGHWTLVRPQTAATVKSAPRRKAKNR